MAASVTTSGLFGRALQGLLMRRATIAAVERPADRFSLLTLEGAALQGVAWTPGQKIQIAMGSAFVARTYTPIEWDASAGRTRILAFDHGDGPGSRWSRCAEAGDTCDFFGPRSPLGGQGSAAPIAVFGDETSVGAARALSDHDRARTVACHFEVANVDDAGQVLERLELGEALLVERRDDDAHLAAFDAAMAAHIAADTLFVLTGRAPMVQWLRQTLKRHAVPTGRFVTKAYWAPGKTGLD